MPKYSKPVPLKYCKPVSLKTSIQSLSQGLNYINDRKERRSTLPSGSAETISGSGQNAKSNIQEYLISVGIRGKNSKLVLHHQKAASRECLSSHLGDSTTQRHPTLPLSTAKTLSYTRCKIVLGQSSKSNLHDTGTGYLLHL